MWDWYERKPRRPANGIRAQSRQFGKTWWASRWLAALDKLVDPGRLSRGRSYARSGQVLNLDIHPGRVDARVQGSRPSPYKVSIKIKALSTRQWEKVIKAMAGQALFAAKLLAGEMPRDIEKAFADAGTSLFPSDEADLETDCSCPDWSNPCKHIAAVYYLLGEQFDADPFLIFRLRGMNKAEILSLLRLERASQEPTPARAKKAKRQPRMAAAEPIEPLEATLEHFWTANDTLQDMRLSIHAPEIDAAPVRRLGEPSFWHGKQVFGEKFVRAYRGVTAAALAYIGEVKRGSQ